MAARSLRHPYRGRTGATSRRDLRREELSHPDAPSNAIEYSNELPGADNDAPHNVLDFRAAQQGRLQRQSEEFASADARAREEQIAARLQVRKAERQRREERLQARRAKAEASEKRFQEKLARTPACHWGLFVATILLALLSIPLVYSASTTLALDHHDNADFFLLRQIGFVVVGLAWFVFVTRLNAKQMRVAVWLLYAIALAGLIAIDFTPLGTAMGSGTKRWLKIPGLPPQQVSELAKIALIGVMADFWSRASRTAQSSMWPWVATGVLALPFIGLVFLQPHLSAALLLGVLPFVVAAHADVPRKHFAKILVPILLCGAVTVFMCKHHAVPFLKTYQQDRIASHFGSSDGTKGVSQADGNYQVEQSMRALVHGGVLGVGPGESLFKQGHLPAPHTDFIMAVIGEEWGLVGLMVMLLAYGAIIFFCLHVGHCAETSFEALLCSGVGTLLAIQVVGNAFVVTGIMPVTGIPLPLLSYGGSGLLCSLTGIGMVLGISRRIGEAQNDRQDATVVKTAASETKTTTKRTSSTA
ncbi:MAG TPA: FtsW/RodA/SpoVE family cell cycle protein, partial [Abditibacteriaceae bacterium]|nr:FtsW/RodA/SpoVE family cell cycle protein [Abditibacteriaceae bacterium]